MKQLLKGYSVIHHSGARFLDYDEIQHGAMAGDTQCQDAYTHGGAVIRQFQPDWAEVKVSDGLTYRGSATGCPDINQFNDDDTLAIALRGWARSAILQPV